MIVWLLKYLLLTCLFLSAASHTVSDTTATGIRDDIEITQIDESTFVHTSYFDLPEYKHVPANGLVYISDGSAYIVDTPWTDEQAGVLVQWFEENLHVSIKGVIVTHWHSDCMGGLKGMHDFGIRSYSLVATGEIARQKGLPVPDVVFTDSLRLMAGDRSVLCRYVGAGHSSDNTVVWLPEEKILFAGCLVKNMRSKNLGNLSDADLDEWPSSLKRLLDEFPDCRTVVPGHGAYGDSGLIRHTLRLLEQNE